jgi:hypothetical protein
VNGKGDLCPVRIPGKTPRSRAPAPPSQHIRAEFPDLPLQDEDRHRLPPTPERVGARYSSPCCPAGVAMSLLGTPLLRRRAAIRCRHPPRKSHSKSQRRPTSGDTSRRRASVCAVQVSGEPCQATPGDAREVTGGQGVAGSNPAVPTQVRRLIRSPGSAFCGSGDQDQGLRSLLTRLDRWSSDRVRLQERAEEARRQEPKPSSPCAQ